MQHRQETEITAAKFREAMENERKRREERDNEWEAHREERVQGPL